jgi:hypothetical protein
MSIILLSEVEDILENGLPEKSEPTQLEDLVGNEREFSPFINNYDVLINNLLKFKAANKETSGHVGFYASPTEIETIRSEIESAGFTAISYSYGGGTLTSKNRYSILISWGTPGVGNTKTITIGSQLTPIDTNSGTTGTFELTTTNIANGTYSVSITYNPDGIDVTVPSITITNNTGVLSVTTNESLTPGDHIIKVTFDGVESTDVSFYVV